MATVAQLNVEIGARVAELQKGLKQAERELRTSGQRFARIGAEMTASLSVPLGLLGATAIKSAGDIESLTLALKSQLGTSQAAEKELAALTEAAKNPGLGLEQAVRGSVRLQGVKLSAEEARNVLIQMGNAIASTGGSAQELDNVTRQFAQMISKGRVLQEDVSILSENMPGLAGLMQKAFGTASVEAIRAMGVSGRDFVLAITDAAKELPRVESGIKNSIGNAVDSLKQSAAKAGIALNNAFNITGLIESVSSAVFTLADGFASLDPDIQKVILSIAGIAIATGPVLRAYGAMNTLSAQLVSVSGRVIETFKSLGGWIINVTQAFNALSLASRAFVLIGLVTAVAALAYNFGLFNRELTAAEKAQAAVNSVQLEARQAIAAEKSQVDTLIKAINSEVVSKGAKERALKRLQEISPQYFGNLKLENGLVNGLTDSYQKYIAALLESARAAAAREKLVEVEKKLIELEDGRLQRINDAKKAADLVGVSRQQSLNQENQLYNEQIAALTATRDRLSEIAAKGFEVKGVEEATSNVKKYAAATVEATKQTKALRDVMKSLADQASIEKVFGEDPEAKAAALTEGIKKLIEAGFSPASKEVRDLKAQLDALFPKVKEFSDIALPSGNPILPVQSQNPKDPPKPKPIDADVNAPIKEFKGLAEEGLDITEKFTSGISTFSEAMADAMKLVKEHGTVMHEVFLSMGNAISDAALSGEASFAKLGQAALGAAAKIIRAYIQQGVAAAVAKALSSIPFPFNLAAAAAAGGVAAALFTKAIGAIGVKGFASGTQDAPGGLAMVGERGPELVRLPQHSRVYSAGQTHGILSKQSPIIVGGTVKFDGRDLYLLIEQQDAKSARSRGRSFSG